MVFLTIMEFMMNDDDDALNKCARCDIAIRIRGGSLTSGA